MAIGAATFPALGYLGAMAGIGYLIYKGKAGNAAFKDEIEKLRQDYNKRLDELLERYGKMQSGIRYEKRGLS